MKSRSASVNALQLRASFTFRNDDIVESADELPEDWVMRKIAPVSAIPLEQASTEALSVYR